MTEQLDGYALYMLDDGSKDIYIPSKLRHETEQRMADLKAELEYNLNPDNIPTWASPELAFQMWLAKNKKPTLFQRIKKWFS